MPPNKPAAPNEADITWDSPAQEPPKDSDITWEDAPHAAPKEEVHPSIKSFIKNSLAGLAEIPGNLADLMANANPDAMPFQTEDLQGVGGRVNKAVGNVTGFQPSDVKPHGFTDYLGRNLGANAPFMAAGVGGGVANTARTLATQGGAVLGQTAAETLAPDSPLAQVAGAVGGAMLTGGAVNGRAISATPDARGLMNRGMTLTPGQLFGRTAKAWEDKLTSIPVLGDVIRGGRGTAMESFNRERYNDALEPLRNIQGSQNVRSTFPPGRAGVGEVSDIIDQHYDALLPQMVAGVDHGLTQDLNTVRHNMLGSGATQDTINRFNNIWNHQFNARLAGNTSMNGEALKVAQSELTRITNQMMKSTSSEDHVLGDGLLQARQAMNDMLARWNPSLADDLGNINKAYARYATIRSAASKIGARDGVFSPEQFSNAVRNADNSAGKGNYARGYAYGQDVSDPARRVMGSEVPDSGSAGRLLASAMMGGAIPFSPAAAATGAGIASAYTRPGMYVLNRLANRTVRPWTVEGFLPALNAGTSKSFLPGGNNK